MLFNISDMLSLYRNSLIGISICIILYNSLHITRDPKKRLIISSIVSMLLLYTLVSLIVWQTIYLIAHLQNKSTYHILIYSLTSTAFIITILYMIHQLHRDNSIATMQKTKT